MSRSVRRWVAGMGLAGGAATAAAMIGAVGAPAARADTIDELLIQSAGDINDAASVYSGIDASLLPAQLAANIGEQVSALQNEADLILQLQSLEDALPEALQTNSQIIAADNQIATAAGDVLSAMNTYVNAADAGDYATGATLSDEVTGYFDRLDLVYAEAFQFLPASINADFTTVFAPFDATLATAIDNFLGDLGSVTDPASAADIAVGLDPATAIDPSIFADLLSSIGF
jgi:tetratricopeptide (TPR) repeat protein